MNHAEFNIEKTLCALVVAVADSEARHTGTHLAAAVRPARVTLPIHTPEAALQHELNTWEHLTSAVKLCLALT